jgi:hypothetical protein
MMLYKLLRKFGLSAFYNQRKALKFLLNFTYVLQNSISSKISSINKFHNNVTDMIHGCQQCESYADLLLISDARLYMKTFSFQCKCL